MNLAPSTCIMHLLYPCNCAYQEFIPFYCWGLVHCIMSHHFKTLLLLLFLHRMACRILILWPGIKPTPPALNMQSFNHWTTRKVSKTLIFNLEKVWGIYKDLACFGHVSFCVSRVICLFVMCHVMSHISTQTKAFDCKKWK